MTLWEADLYITLNTHVVFFLNQTILSDEHETETNVQIITKYFDIFLITWSMLLGVIAAMQYQLVKII